MNTAQRRRVHPKYAITRAGAAVCLLAAAVTRAFGQGVVAAHAMPCKACHEALFNRSEEHTSELQSQSNLVCRLLLEKKKRKQHEVSRMQPSWPLSPHALYSSHIRISRVSMLARGSTDAMCFPKRLSTTPDPTPRSIL